SLRGFVARAPDGVAAVGAVAPQDIGFPVAIEISDACHAPRKLADCSRLLLDVCIARQPDCIAAAGGIAPEEVVGAVAVEITDSNDLPGLLPDGGERDDRG